MKLLKEKPALATRLQKFCDDADLHITVNDHV